MKIRFFDYDDTKEFNSVYQMLMPEFDGFELFDAPPAFAAYEDGEPVAIATLLILPENAATPGSDDNSSLEADLTLFVLPKYRRRGIAKELTLAIKEYMTSNFPEVSVVYALPDALLRSSFARHCKYTELLFSLAPEQAVFLNSHNELYSLLSGNNFLIAENFDNPYVCRLTLNGEEIAHVAVSQDDNYACLYGLYIKPEYRHRGIGQALTEYAAGNFLQKGIPIFLNVRDTNTAALNLYKKIGFTEADSCKYFKLPLTHP